MAGSLLQLAALWCIVLQSAPLCTAAGSTPWELHFSPRGGCTASVVAAIDAARASVRVQTYEMTSRPIADALVRARARGVDVEVLADRSQVSQRGSLIGQLARAKIKVWIDSSHKIMHDKVVVIDQKRVVTGSFNFTTNAEFSNCENCLVLTDPALAARYLEHWGEHRAHCKRFP